MDKQTDLRINIITIGHMTLNEIKASFEVLLCDGEELVNTRRSGAKKARKWCLTVRDWLQTYLPEAGLAKEVTLALPSFEPTNTGRGLRPVDQKGIQRVIKILLRATEIIPQLNEKDPYTPTPDGARRVFVVHGKNDGLKVNVARLIEKFGLEAIILHEQPNRGRTIIEKFSEHSNVAFAVVLLTGDDKGGLSTQGPDAYLLRARQNVIFELGYFVGKLTRRRVCAIYQDGVELPSDYHGVLFIPHDDKGAWELALAKELRDAGLPVDLNRV